MKTTRPNFNIKKLGRMYDAKGLSFDYPIQRKGGQWDDLQKSLLIHSIVSDYPVPPVLFLKSENEEGNEVDFVIDGKQRITNILDYISGVKDKDGNYPSNAFKLHADTPTAFIEGSNEELEISGKYFDELSDDLQAEITSATFQVQRLEDATDEEIEELFFRWNNGTPLTKQQKGRALMGVEKAIVIDELQNHPFLTEMAQFTPLQLKRSDDEAVVLQTMMLMSGEIESLVADKILKFATEMRDADVSNVASAIKDAMDYLYSVNTTSPLFKKLHLPTLLMVAKKAHDERVEANVFSAWIDDFTLAIDRRKEGKALVKTKYKEFTGAGSVKRDKVYGRRDSMLAHFDEFRVAYANEQKRIQEEEAKAKEELEMKAKVNADKEAITNELNESNDFIEVNGGIEAVEVEEEVMNA